MSDAVRHGSRWLHAPPDEDEVRDWFGKQPLHPGMEESRERYLGGIVLIGASEKVKVSKRKQNGDTYVAEQDQAVFVPYVKVDTRIAYFHDYARHLSGEDVGKYIGIFQPVPQTRIEDAQSGYYNAHLPEGFSMLPVRNRDDSVSRFLVCTYRVSIIERASPDSPPILQGIGTKQTPLARQWADDNAMMKAETGAIGRALGVAGILVVGTGVATAEDMQEAAQGPVGAAGSSAEGAVLPDEPIGPAATGGADPGAASVAEEPDITEEQSDDALRQTAIGLQAEMERDHSESWEAYRAWWAGRGFGLLAEMSGPALRGAVTKLERDLDKAKTAKLAEATEL